MSATLTSKWDFVRILCTVFHIFQTASGKTKKVVEIEETFSNPWCVENVTAFLKFCCPECDYCIPDIQMFSDHAVENHIKSRALFGEENANAPQQLQQPLPHQV